ncbi:MAG TPA: HupE/UreJ family protein [Flavobacterium sp.]|nr:HupE/UreJ family protein [Flavobacterium sp.]
MSEFWIYLQIGFNHVLDSNGYDHLLFLTVMTVPYAFKDWRKVLLLVTIFTIGHTLSLLLAVYEVIMIKVSLIELLIPFTILITALNNLFTIGKTIKSGGLNIIGLITLFFGIIHGLGFSSYFKSIVSGDATDKLVPTLEFALGIELAQFCIVLFVLILAFIVQHFFRFSKRDWTLVMSSFVIGVVLPMIIKNEIW